MNRKLTDQQIETVARRLLARDPAASGRALRAALKRRFGSPGKTDRVYSVWRQLRDQAPGGRDATAATVDTLRQQVTELRERLSNAEVAGEAALERARVAEGREVAHQDRWAREIHRLREEVRSLAEAGRVRGQLESRLLDLQRELAQARLRLAAYELPPSDPPVAGR